MKIRKILHYSVYVLVSSYRLRDDSWYILQQRGEPVREEIISILKQTEFSLCERLWTAGSTEICRMQLTSQKQVNLYKAKYSRVEYNFKRKSRYMRKFWSQFTVKQKWQIVIVRTSNGRALIETFGSLLSVETNSSSASSCAVTDQGNWLFR
jgi:hypothetical protein